MPQVVHAPVAAPAPQPGRVLVTVGPRIETGPARPRSPLPQIGRDLRPNEQIVLPVRTPVGARRIDPSTPSPFLSLGTGGRAVRGCASALPQGFRLATRCGPDRDWAADRGDPLGGLVVRGSTRGAADVFVVPQARTTFDVTRPPPGYRMAWRDGRLNPHRGPRTLLGDLQSSAIWTDGTPRRLRGVIYTTR
jgi:hypothetical protein